MSDFPTDRAVARPDHMPGMLRFGNFIVCGEPAELVKRDFAELSRAAYQAQGPRAFEDPKSSAVVHEAGHAALYAYYGLEMRLVKIRQRKKGIERGHWIGQAQPVESYSWATGPDTSPEKDFKDACILMAGWLAEVLFDSDNLRIGSSLDERTNAGLLSHNISQKTGVDLQQVRTAICSTTCSILKKNESVVRKIASVLDRNGCIRREVLSSILAKVEQPS